MGRCSPHHHHDSYILILTEEQYPSHILNQYNPEFEYEGTESEPRARADQQAEDEEERRLVQDPSHIIHQYTPPPPLPNQHLYTGECKSGTCDSQGFCIDSGCGSVIRGGDQCKHKKHKKNNIHPTTPEKNLQYQYPEYSGVTPPLQTQPQPSQQQPSSGSGTFLGYLNSMGNHRNCSPALHNSAK